MIAPLRLPLIGASLLALAACGGPEYRYSVPVSAPVARVAVSASSIEVRDVMLPTYASLEEIYTGQAGGLIQSQPDLLWADEPGRAATLELSRDLGIITGARVAPEPWPFDDYADARVEVRVEEFLATLPGEETPGSFRISGQYFVATLDAEGRDRAARFDVAAAAPAGSGIAGVAAARAAAMAQLAETIAREGLR
ncbi:PqiC family protein [Pseudoroseicyclus aestuarii]|uniref:ABC-type transport auxiliary lipoprotein component domain-containing protein n=1 Tax=Pseudoroseicyclus aestuarii TaxID=1795041 RepID=A0A318SXC7_9RHOB|nr:ABC-type transport auxiliary lipoprotein family protein [Pseudoroseicyclus aestuarii]PYE86005.1 hypothetical protein DFP88_101680 [Pseudoroseicyclus aestuarii]